MPPFRRYPGDRKFVLKHECPPLLNDKYYIDVTGDLRNDTENVDAKAMRKHS